MLAHLAFRAKSSVTALQRRCIIAASRTGHDNSRRGSPLYQPQFRFQHDAAKEIQTHDNVVAGASLTWADDSSLGLHRRAILKFKSGGPTTVLIVKKHRDNHASSKLAELATWLQERSIKVLVERQVHAEFSHLLPCSAEALPSVDLCITLGGDGTVLHLASLFTDDARPMPPVISFAMGTLGFLTPFSADGAQDVLSKLLWPPWQAEPIYCTLRTRRRCEVYWGGRVQRVHTVLNECLVDRGASPAMVLLECFVDGRHATTVQADGLIIAPPSGSTAYSMSAGGPMIAPSVPCTIITPVAPHSLSFRPLVVPENSVIEVHLPSNSRAQARASFDGRHAMRMLRDSSIVCRASRYALPMINRHPLDEDWYEGITQKLKWTGSLRSLTNGPLRS